MELILCHVTADFDALGAAVGLTRLKPGAKLVLAGGAHPAVRDFLALHRDEYPLIERRAVNAQQIRRTIVVDTQKRDRLGKTAEWLDLPQLEAIEVYDHHLESDSDIRATYSQIEPVGATTTLIVEQLQQSAVSLTPVEATVMALGIHVDTGSLTYDQTTPRDAAALAWLMAAGANVRQIAEYVEPALSPQLQRLLTEALDDLRSDTCSGYTLSWICLQTPDYVPGLSSLASRLVELTESDALLLAAESGNPNAPWLTVIGRSRIEGTDLNALFHPLGGGGHSQAAALRLREVNPTEIVDRLVEQLKAQIPRPVTARELMSSPVRTIRPDTTISEAERILLRYGHSGLSVVNEEDRLVGVISRRDLDLALHHGFGHAPVKGYMTRDVKTIAPETSLPEIESLMVTYDIGRLPVLEEEQLVGIVTRTDVLRQLHQERGHGDMSCTLPIPDPKSLIPNLRDRLAPPLWELLAQAAQLAQERGWHLYLVGGAVRDLLLASPDEGLLLEDIDLVVDGFHQTAEAGAGVALAQALLALYPNARLEVHGAFQTAALLWHNDPVLDSLWIDIATARTEFYPYPAANPEVEASSIRQDLYRRDFTINAMAVRLTAAPSGQLPLLDFFGGLLDLRSRHVRVLHANSFIEDPTRIYRAVRFAVRLDFAIEPQTKDYIRYAIESGVYDRSLMEKGKVPALQTRLKAELKYILQAPYWDRALKLLASLGALRCIHPTLALDETLWWQVRLVDRWLRRFDPERTLRHWQVRLEVLIAHLAPEVRGKVAENLQLPADTIERLQNLAAVQANVSKFLPACERPSQVVRLLRQYDLPMLVLLAVRSSRSIRRKIWQHLTQWAEVQAPLNGNDLKKLGYKPGPRYREILDALLAATLDGEIQGEEDAKGFLAQHYPLSD
jgi:tRNA nucleotidyltransferase (CCA-adding enzyme)